MDKAVPNKVDNCNAPLNADNPTVEDPICKEGAEVKPLGSASAPVRVPPVSAKSKLACPVKEAVIVPALKLPVPSRTTILDGVLIEEILANLSFVIVAAVISASTMSEVDNNPLEEL